MMAFLSNWFECSRIAVWLAVYCLALATSTMVAAQQVPTDPTSSHIFPAGGQRGTKIDVRVGGECLPPLTKFRLFGEGLSASEFLGDKLVSYGDPSPRRRPGEVHIYYPKEWRQRIDIAPDASLGMHLWRLSCARGGTGGRPFIVGELPEFIETESNSSLELAESVTLPITINGQINGERDLDYFQFAAKQNEIVTVDLVSRRLGSPLEPVAEFYDEDGRRVAASVYRVGSDPVITMRAARSGNYRLMVANLGFQGGPQNVYRATLSNLPYVPFVFPAGGPLNSLRTYEAFKLVEGNRLEGVPTEVAIPKDAVGEQWLRGNMATMNPLLLAISEHPDQVETEGNNTIVAAQSLSVPASIHGRFLDAQDEDWFRFTAAQGSLWSIECRRFPPGGDCLPIVTVTDAKGAPLAAASMADDPRQPCRLQWRAPIEGTFALRLRDMQQGVRGGPDFVYCLSVGPAIPGFELNVASDFLNVLQGGKAEIEVKARRTGDFAGPIDLQIEGLPEGVRCESKQIAAGQETIKLALIAEDLARSCDVTLKIRGVGTHDGMSLSAVAQVQHLGRDSDGVSIGSAFVDHLQLTVRHKPVLRLFCNEAYQYAYRGSVYPYAMEIERLNGFTGKVHIELADRQIKDLDGIVVRETTIEAGQTQFQLPVYLPETMHINVQAHSNVYAQGYVVFDDAWGQKLSQLFVSEMRCMIRPLPTVVKLVAVDNEVIARPKEPIACRLRLDRTSLFAGAMKIELIDPPHESGYFADPVTIAPDESTATMLVQLSDERRLQKVDQLTFRAIGEMPGYVAIISEASIRVRDYSDASAN